MTPGVVGREEIPDGGGKEKGRRPEENCRKKKRKLPRKKTCPVRFELTSWEKKNVTED